MGTREDHIKYRIEKSELTLKSAKVLAANDCWDSCVNRLYYSCFNLVIALLLKNNYESKSHKGIRIQFFHHFVKTELVSIEDGKLFSKLFDMRQKEDYSEFINYGEDTIMPLIGEVEEFNRKIIELINKK
jgi:uncharacterized protein (UPF0332 family)